MNRPGLHFATIRRLVLKDWQLQQWTLWVYVVFGLVAGLLLALRSPQSFFTGGVLLLYGIFLFGFSLPQATVIRDREQNRVFVMSLPISGWDYVAAKILINLLLFLIPFLPLALGVFGVIAKESLLPDGLMPYVALVLLTLFASFCLMLGTALATESAGFFAAAAFLSFLAMIYLNNLPARPEIAQRLQSDDTSWCGIELILAAAMLAAIGLTIAFTFHVQSRKKNFV